MIVTVLDTVTSLIAGCTIFGILGNLAYESGSSDISTVTKGGTGLAFISYPDAIAKFEIVPQVTKLAWSFVVRFFNVRVAGLFSAVLFHAVRFGIRLGCVYARWYCHNFHRSISKA